MQEKHRKAKTKKRQLSEGRHTKGKAAVPSGRAAHGKNFPIEREARILIFVITSGNSGTKAQLFLGSQQTIRFLLGKHSLLCHAAEYLTHPLPGQLRADVRRIGGRGIG